MEKGVPSSLFVNDGSFMERFKQLQQQKDDKDKAAALEESKPPIVVKGSSAPKPSIAFKVSMERKTAQTPSGGKLAFSLKQKSKLVAPPVKLDADEDEEDQDAGKLVDEKPVKKQKLGRSDASEHASKQVDVAPPSPSDLTVKKVADKLASFVAKNGRQFEHITHQKNPGGYLSNSFLMRVVPITNTMRIGLLKRKKLFQRTRNSKLLKVVIQLPSPQAALSGQFHSNPVIKHPPLLCMTMRSLDLQWEEQAPPVRHQVLILLQ